MAILQNQNVAFNYRGILNLDATTINTPLDATLRAVTDGAGTASLLQLSTEAVGLSRTVNLSAGATTPRLFNVAYTINNSGAQTGTLTGLFLNATETALNGITHNLMDLQVGGVSKFLVSRTGAMSTASSIGFQFGSLFSCPVDGQITMFNNATSGFTRLNFGGTTSSFPAIKRNGADIDFIRADDSGYASLACSQIYVQNAFNANNNTLIYGNGAGILTLSNLARTDFNRLQLGGTTSSFPAIKRNGAAIDFRLADDSGYCNIAAQSITANYSFTINTLNISGTYLGYAGSTNARLAWNTNGFSLETGAVTTQAASAILDVKSTTQGFLPPRMTTAQINAIATPAEGLVAYNTTISHLCVYQAGVWVKINHSPM